MGQAALARVQALFDWDRSADLTYGVYQQVLGLTKGSESIDSESRNFSNVAL